MNVYDKVISDANFKMPQTQSTIDRITKLWGSLLLLQIYNSPFFFLFVATANQWWLPDDVIAGPLPDAERTNPQKPSQLILTYNSVKKKRKPGMTSVPNMQYLLRLNMFVYYVLD